MSLRCAGSRAGGAGRDRRSDRRAPRPARADRESAGADFAYARLIRISAAGRLLTASRDPRGDFAITTERIDLIAGSRTGRCAGRGCSGAASGRRDRTGALPIGRATWPTRCDRRSHRPDPAGGEPDLCRTRRGRIERVGEASSTVSGRVRVHATALIEAEHRLQDPAAVDLCLGLSPASLIQNQCERVVGLAHLPVPGAPIVPSRRVTRDRRLVACAVMAVARYPRP